jgi:hypothetical protein
MAATLWPVRVQARGESVLEQCGKDLGLADVGALRGGEQCQRSVLGQVAQMPVSLRTSGLF